MAREVVARDRARGIRSFRDLAAQRQQTGARWHGPSLRNLRQPTPIMCGDADPLLRPLASRETAAAIPGGAPGGVAGRRACAAASQLAHYRPAHARTSGPKPVGYLASVLP
jgi:pimeloyl-ACP methyl ester carboxylesterase